MKAAKPTRQPPAKAPAPCCALCGRDFGSVFDLPRVTVVRVDAVPLGPNVHDTMVGEKLRDRSIRSLRRLPKCRTMVEYVATLRSLVGESVAPAALQPAWMHAPSAWQAQIPGAPAAAGDRKFWTLGFRTAWDGDEATLTVKVMVGGYSLGSAYGAVAFHVTDLLVIRVRPHVPQPIRARFDPDPAAEAKEKRIVARAQRLLQQQRERPARRATSSARSARPKRRTAGPKG